MYFIFSDHFSNLDIDSFADSTKEENEDTDWNCCSLPVFSPFYLPWKNPMVTAQINNSCGHIAVFR